jgi:hypothetical protein
MMKSLSLLAAIGMCGIFQIPVPHRTVQDSELIDEIRRKVLARYHVKVDPRPVSFSNEPSRVVPRLYYHWATFQPPEVTPIVSLYAVAAVGANRARVVRNVSDWAAVAAPWYPRTVDDAERTCVEMFRIVRSDLGPGSQSYTPYDPGHDSLPPLNAHDRSLITLRVTTGSRVVRHGSSARWDVRVWVLSFKNNVAAHRLRCSLPHQSAGAASLYSVAVVDSVIGPPNPLAL